MMMSVFRKLGTIFRHAVIWGVFLLALLIYFLTSEPLKQHYSKNTDQFKIFIKEPYKMPDEEQVKYKEFLADDVVNDTSDDFTLFTEYLSEISDMSTNDSIEIVENSLSNMKLNEYLPNALLISNLSDDKENTVSQIDVLGAQIIKIKDLPPSFQKNGPVPYRNLMEDVPPKFLPNYRNPCWYEELDPNHFYVQKDHTILGHFYWYNTYYYKNQNQRYLQRIKEGKPWRLRCLPYFYLAGFVKAGTTEIFHNIQNHPMFADHVPKEIHWWNRYRNRLSKQKNMSSSIRDYVDVYDPAEESIIMYRVADPRWAGGYHPKIIGDGSTKTLTEMWTWQQHPENKNFSAGPDFVNAHYIKHVTPDAKIIVSMRNPAERVYSYFRMNKGKSPETFHKGVKEAIEKFKGCLRKFPLSFCIYNPDVFITRPHMNLKLAESIYYAHLIQWLDVFPKEQIHFIKLEEFSKNRITGLNKIFEFLGIDQIAENVLESQPQNMKLGCPTCTDLPMLNKTKQVLDEFFKPYNKMLAEFLGDEKWLFERDK